MALGTTPEMAIVEWGGMENSDQGIITDFEGLAMADSNNNAYMSFSGPTTVLDSAAEMQGGSRDLTTASYSDNTQAYHSSSTSLFPYSRPPSGTQPPPQQQQSQPQPQQQAEYAYARKTNPGRDEYLDLDMTPTNRAGQAAYVQSHARGGVTNRPSQGYVNPGRGPLSRGGSMDVSNSGGSSQSSAGYRSGGAFGRGQFSLSSPTEHHHQYLQQQQQQQQQQLAARPISNSNAMSAKAVADPGSKPRGQGYRKLWQQVTKVGKGEKLNENGSLAFSDMTVEDLLRIVLKLAPQESAIDAVKQGLYYLDSSATAALLKELAKQGHIKRSGEIFDWLRSLPPDHELAALCDLYTYTTMISQCGSHQQLRRALELVAEMRSKGIDCNVHTYSALMNVCIKANELDLAEDVYKQMVDEGCTPNLVTYNILVDVYVKQCKWGEAVCILDTLEQQGIQAEVRTYNTVISACNKSGQPEQALRIYEKMLAFGIKPSATTYTALISAYGKKGQVEKAMEIFQDMVRRGCERNVITYSSLISACEKAGRWELALDLFERMHSEDCKPNVVTYNSLIAACAQGGHWEKAVELFDQMHSNMCRPDGITYGALVMALERGGQWRRALQVFDEMQTQGVGQADASVFNSLLEVLWQSGVLLAQVRAMQLWSVANRSGHFRIYTNTKQEGEVLQYSSVAFTCGAAIVTLMRWLIELRMKVQKEGPASLRERVVMSLHKSKAGRFERAPAQIHDAIAATLAGCDSPFTVQVLDQMVALEAPSAALTAWMHTEAFAELVFIAQGSPLRKVALDVLVSEDAAVAARCVDAFGAVKRYEEMHAVNVPQIQQLLLAQRGQVVQLALKYGAAFGFKQDTTYDGLQLFDRSMAACGEMLNINLWPLCLCSCLLIAAHQVESPSSWRAYEQVTALTGFAADALANMERNVCLWLRQDVSCISPLRAIQLYLERLGHYLPEFAPADRISKDLQELVYKAACSVLCMSLRPSVVAVAMLYVLRKRKGVMPFWPTSLQLMTGFVNLQVPEVTTAILHVESLANA